MGVDTRPIPDARRADVTREELAPGAIAGEYEILSKIASGGCGTVYAAEHRVLRRQAAVKVLHRDMAASAESVQRFVREARAVNLIKHPNIVDVYDYGQLRDGRPYFVMEFLDGINLASFVQDHGTLSPRAALEILEPICNALAAAHDAGVVHRDVKASNIFVAKPGLPWRVKLLDFGVAKMLNPAPWEPELTTADHRLGTPIAMAPEQVRSGPVDIRTDVYAMGVLLYNVLTGEYPFRGDAHELERQHLTMPAPAPSTVVPLPAAIDELVLRCLDKDPDRRFPSMTAFLGAFRDAILDDTNTQVVNRPDIRTGGAARHRSPEHAIATQPIKRHFLRSSRFAMAAIALLALAGAVLVVLQLNRGERAPGQPAPVTTPVIDMKPTKPAPIDPDATNESADRQAVRTPTTNTRAKIEVKKPPVSKPEAKKRVAKSEPETAKPAEQKSGEAPERVKPELTGAKPTDPKSLETPATKPLEPSVRDRDSPFMPVRPQKR